MKTAVVVCPGRGTYNKTELGYLARHFPDAALLGSFDTIREETRQPTLRSLDGAARYSPAEHTRGDNASALIFAATIGDYLAIDRDQIEVVAVTGNSMGWYSALTCGGAADPSAGFRIANTMGTLMQRALIGGQLIYPFVGEDWRPDPARKMALLELVGSIGCRPDHVLALSIDLGGMLVLGGNEAGLEAFAAGVEPAQGRYPMRLPNHAAFHIALQEPVSREGKALLDPSSLASPELPLVDGRGKIWWPGASNAADLFAYTLGDQVTTTYNFTRAITVAAKEFAPDLFIVTGPGTTLGGAIAQSLILSDWQGLRCRDDFRARQKRDPLLVSMGMAEQRGLVAR